MSPQLFVSPGTRLDARLSKATKRPWKEIAASKLWSSPWDFKESRLTRSVCWALAKETGRSRLAVNVIGKPRETCSHATSTHERIHPRAPRPVAGRNEWRVALE